MLWEEDREEEKMGRAEIHIVEDQTQEEVYILEDRVQEGVLEEIFLEVEDKINS